MLSREEKLARDRERKRKKYYEDVEKSRAEQRGRYERNAENYRNACRAKTKRYRERYQALWRMAKLAARKRDAEAVNAKQREWYRANRKQELARIAKRRDRSNPSRGLERLIRDLSSGSISLREAHQRLGERIALAHEAGAGHRRRRPANSGSNGASRGVRQGDRGPNKGSE